MVTSRPETEGESNSVTVTAHRGTMLSFPVAIVLACVILIQSGTRPIAAIAILSLIVAAFVFDMFVLYSPTRRFYDPNELPPRTLPSSE
jgi:hypothetical protein